MQFPESWLREFCNPPLSTQELADALTMADQAMTFRLVVKEIARLDGAIDSFVSPAVAARVLARVKDGHCS